MKQTFKAKTSILPEEQKVLWPKLAPTYDLEMTLYGGTAIALRLGHRESVDFDFFSAHPLKRDEIILRMPFLKSATVIQDERDAWTLLVPEGNYGNQVKISFFGSIGFGRVDMPDRDAETGILIASKIDLLGTKLKVIHQRAEWKDYYDIAALLRNGLRLEDGLGASQALFGSMFPVAETLRAVVYFDDGDLHKLNNEDKATLINSAKNLGEITLMSKQSNDLSIVSEELAFHFSKNHGHSR